MKHWVFAALAVAALTGTAFAQTGAEYSTSSSAGLTPPPAPTTSNIAQGFLNGLIGGLTGIIIPPTVTPPPTATTQTQVNALCPPGPYVKGQYMCGDFSNDFNKNCDAAGMKSWSLVITYDPTLCPTVTAGHQINILQECDPTTVNTKYCAVEPQNGAQYCWFQESGESPVPPYWIRDQLFAHYRMYDDCYKSCVAKGIEGSKCAWLDPVMPRSGL